MTRYVCTFAQSDPDRRGLLTDMHKTVAFYDKEENLVSPGTQCVLINVKKIAFGNTLRIRKWESRFYRDSSKAVMKFATLLTPSSVYRSRTPFSNIPQWAQ